MIFLKRILLLNYEFPPIGGGGGVASKKIAMIFIENGYHVDCITTRYKGQKRMEEVDGISVYRVSIPCRNNKSVASIVSLILFPFLSLYSACKLCMKNKYEFIKTHFAIPTGPLGIILSKIFKIRNILFIYGGDIYDPTKRYSPHNNGILHCVVQWVLNYSDIIISDSQDIKMHAKQYYKINKQIFVIPLPYQKVTYQKISRELLGLEMGVKYLISVGRMVERKGYKLLLNAVSLIKDDALRLIIVGDGPQRQELVKLAGKLGLGDRVIFTGFVSEEIKFQFLAVSDIYILSSYHEGFGIVLQEAMQVGLPIITSNNGGQKDFVINGNNGIYFESGNMQDMCDKIKYLLDNNELIRVIQKNNLEKVEEFSQSRIYKVYTRLLESI